LGNTVTAKPATKEEAEEQSRKVVDEWAREVPAYELITSRNPVFPHERDKEMVRVVADLFGVTGIDPDEVLTELFKALYRSVQPWLRLPFITLLQRGWYRGAASTFARGLGDLVIDRCWQRSILASTRKQSKLRF
jgi:hypothetical protein